MTWLKQITVGMPVVASDGPVGSVASVPRVDLGDPSAPAEIIVLANQDNAGPGVEEFLRVTRDMIERVETRALVLNVTRREVPRASAAVAAAHSLRGNGSSLQLPVVEEQLNVRTRVVELGHVTVRKRVDEYLDERVVELTHQEVEIDRVPVNRVIPDMIVPYMDGDTYVVPVIEEEIVVERRLRLKEELRIRRVVARHEETLHTPFYRERVSVEEHWHNRAQSDAATPSPSDGSAETVAADTTTSITPARSV